MQYDRQYESKTCDINSLWTSVCITRSHRPEIYCRSLQALCFNIANRTGDATVSLLNSFFVP